MGGNDLDAAKRPPGVPTFHSAQDINALVRDFTKWDDQPVSLQHFAQSFVRTYKMAMTPPARAGDDRRSTPACRRSRCAITARSFTIPRYVPSSPPQGDTNAVREAARLLANAERPVIVVDQDRAHGRTASNCSSNLPKPCRRRWSTRGGRMNFPKTHYLSRMRAAAR